MILTGSVSLTSISSADIALFAKMPRMDPMDVEFIWLRHPEKAFSESGTGVLAASGAGVLAAFLPPLPSIQWCPIRDVTCGHVTCGHDVAGIMQRFLDETLQNTMVLKGSTGRPPETFLERTPNPLCCILSSRKADRCWCATKIPCYQSKRYRTVQVYPDIPCCVSFEVILITEKGKKEIKNFALSLPLDSRSSIITSLRVANDHNPDEM